MGRSWREARLRVGVVFCRQAALLLKRNQVVTAASRCYTIT